MTLMAIQKELKLEEMLEKEEVAREEREERELRLQMQKEKSKDDCLIKSIKEKEMEDQFNVSKANAEEAIQELKEEAKKEILAKRQQIKLKIAKMRKRAQRKKLLLKGQLQTLRSEVAGELSTASKEGDISNCFIPSDLTKPKVEAYCGKNFAENPQKYAECIALDTFCYVCCENEFGDMHIRMRDKCYDICDGKKKEAPSSTGKWQWIPNIQ